MNDAPEGGSLEIPNEIKKQHHRDKIKASVLLDRLQKNALGELQPEMTSQQIKSAEICLNKVVPNLSAVTVANEDDKPFKFVTETRRTIVDPRADNRLPDSAGIPTASSSGQT